MSLTPAAQRAVEWLEQQIHDLASVRHATARDPVFRNWRQGTVTVMQRIWPGDTQRLERFRRIPFSPADPRADSRAIREAYSRGCQEAQRVLKEFIENVREQGVAASAPTASVESPDDFAGGIPTLQLGGAAPSAAPEPTKKRAPAQAKPAAAAPPAPPIEPVEPAEPVVPASEVHGDMGDLPPTANGESCPLPPRKPRRTKPRLRDLLDRAQESARAIVAPPREEPTTAPVASEPVVDRPSVVTSRPTTLRGNIDKVSLDSLISPEFRESTSDTVDPLEPLDTFATDETLPPHEVEASVEPVVESIAETRSSSEVGLSPALEDPEFAVEAAAEVAPPSVVTPPAVLRLVTPLPAEPVPAPVSEATTSDEADPVMPDAEVEAFAEAAEAFLHTSPVLGASAVPRAPAVSNVREERLFVHPDAIAIASIVDDLQHMGIPESRHPETRARLLDLAQRLEHADLEWHILRAAVWFAMEYPALACRVVPVLLPRMDRAA